MVVRLCVFCTFPTKKEPPTSPAQQHDDSPPRALYIHTYNAYSISRCGRARTSACVEPHAVVCTCPPGYERVWRRPPGCNTIILREYDEAPPPPPHPLCVFSPLPPGTVQWSNHYGMHLNECTRPPPFPALYFRPLAITVRVSPRRERGP